MNVHAIEFHRNGVGGAPFHVVQFSDTVDGTERRMVATVFEERGVVAVLDLDEPGLRWRGDHFEKQLRDEIALADLTGESFEHR